MNDALTSQRDQIVEAALPHIPFDGWTMHAMRQGARDAGLTDGDALRAFPYGTRKRIASASDSPRGG